MLRRRAADEVHVRAAPRSADSRPRLPSGGVASFSGPLKQAEHEDRVRQWERADKALAAVREQTSPPRGGEVTKAHNGRYAAITKIWEAATPAWYPAEANGDDPLALVVSLNVKRRNLTASQRAVAAAEACQMFDTSARKIAPAFDVSRDYAAKAVALTTRAPDLAESVKAGNRALAEVTGVPVRLPPIASLDSRARSVAVS